MDTLKEYVAKLKADPEIQQKVAGAVEEKRKALEAQLASLNSFQTRSGSDRTRKGKTGE